MKRVLLPSFIATVALASACGGGKPNEETPISVNPPAPDGSPGIGDGAGPPPGDEVPGDEVPGDVTEQIEDEDTMPDDDDTPSDETPDE